MKKLFLSLWLLFPIWVSGQIHDYSAYQGIVKKIETIASMEDAAMRKASWDAFVKTYGLPYAQGDSVVLAYKGPATKVVWQGDFNFWGRVDSVNTAGTQLATSDIWIWKAQFPEDARLDYKIQVDDDWILDPANPLQQWSGVNNGTPNSYFAMPSYRSELSQTKKREPKGQWVDKIFESVFLPYDIRVDVFIPEKAKGPLPVIYVTDGQEYRHEEMGNMPVVIDNLLQERRITPVVAVFIDMRNPDDLTENRRVSQLPLNPAFAQFIVRELVPWVELTFKTSRKSEDRALMGTSLGGLHAAYMAHIFPDFFGKIAIHSPAFWFNEEIYPLVESTQLRNTQFFMSTGTVYDTQADAQKMKGIFEQKGYPLTYMEVNEGHSWGNWRALLDDILVEFFPGSKN
jgi:enterochelin esterase-like enzyme